MADEKNGKPRPKRKGPDPDWFKHKRACRPGGKTGHYTCVQGCFWQQCCARRALELTTGSPPNGNVLSVRQISQENSIRITFPA